MKTFFRALACVAFTFAAASFLILNQVMATTDNQIGVVKGVSTVELAITSSENVGTTSYTLTVAKTGNGTVTANVTSINCGTACSASFSSNTSVQLIALPATGYTFSSWGGGCTAGESPTTCSVLMSANKTITATFAAIVSAPIPVTQSAVDVTSTSATLTGNVHSGGLPTTAWFRYIEGINVSNCAQISQGGNLSLPVVSIPSSTIGTFYISSVASLKPGTTYSYCAIAQNDESKKTTQQWVYADNIQTFTTTTAGSADYSLTVIKTGEGTVTSSDGKINCGSICSAAYSNGASVTLKAFPGQGQIFAGWSGCEANGSFTCTFTISSNKNVSANFAAGTTGNVTATQNPTPVSSTLVPGQAGVTLSKVDLSVSSTTFVYLNGVQAGSDSATSLRTFKNVKVYLDSVQIGSTIDSLISNGQYNYGWALFDPIVLSASTTKTITIKADIDSLAPSGTVQLGIWGLNFAGPGAYATGLPVKGPVMKVGGSTISPISIISPQGGDVWRIGSTYTIQWQNSDVSPVARNVQLYTNPVGSSTGGLSTVCLIANSVPDTGSYTWTIPTSLDRTCWGSHVLSVLRLDGSNTKGQSASFTISSTTSSMFKISEITPFNSAYTPGSKIEFKVRGVDSDGTFTTAAEGISASGQVYAEGVPYEPVLYGNYNLSDPATGWYSITVPAPSVAGNYKMRVVLWCGFDSGKPCSDKYGSGGPQVEAMVPFTVSSAGTSGTIKIINPSGGARFLIGNTYTIGWSTNGIPTSLYSAKPLLEVLDQSGNPLTFWHYDTTFAGSEDNRFGRVDFTIPSSLVNTMVKFRVTIKDANNVYTGTSGDVYFASSLPNSCATNSELVRRAALGTDEFSRSGYATSIHPEIVKYRIQWFAGSWSQWYTTGIDDVDWKTNNDGSGRRVWAYFGDHTHEYMKCNTAQAGITITSPNGGEQWEVGKIYSLTWKSLNLPSNSAGINIDLINYNGTDSVRIASNVPLSSTSYNWRIPPTLSGGFSEYKIAISVAPPLGQGGASPANDESDRSFTITKVETGVGEVKTMTAPTAGYYAFKLLSYDSAASSQFIDINNKISLSAPAAPGVTQLQLTSPLKADTSYIIFNSDTDGIDQLDISPAAGISANVITLSKALTGNYPVTGTYIVPLMGNYWGRFPTPEPAYNLGYFTAGQEIKVAHSSNLNYSQVGPFISSNNPDYFYITQDGNKFTAYVDEGFKIGQLDAKWEVNMTDAPVTNLYPIKFPLVKANNAGTVHPYMSQLRSSTVINPTPTPSPIPMPPKPISPREEILLERIQQLEYRVTELERQVVSTEKSLVTKVDTNLTSRVAGKILLQVEGRGEAWYVDKDTSKKFYLKDGDTAYAALQAFGLGITNDNLSKIPVATDTQAALVDTDGDGLDDKLEESLGTDANKADSDGDSYSDGIEVASGYSPLGLAKLTGDKNLSGRLQGKILLQVEGRGQAWYVLDGKRYYLKDGPSAYEIMRAKSLGITNDDLRKIDVGEFE